MQQFPLPDTFEYACELIGKPGGLEMINAEFRLVDRPGAEYIIVIDNVVFAIGKTDRSFRFKLSSLNSRADAESDFLIQSCLNHLACGSRVEAYIGEAGSGALGDYTSCFGLVPPANEVAE